jgi:membrane-bound acyltransferase YfiQ involved in biofilm formation
MSQSRKIFKEVILVRAFACLCVLMIHVLLLAKSQYDVSRSFDLVLNAARLVVNVGTPMFIFLFMFLISKNNPDELPNQLIKKRLTLLGLPYLAMIIFYTAIDFSSGQPLTFEHISIQLLKNISGEFHGYFILIVFQFLFIYKAAFAYLKKSKPLPILIVSFIINFGYLSFFNFVPPFGFSWADFFWNRTSWIPFPGWIFYFTLGYYCGLHYMTIMKFLRERRVLVLSMPIILTILLILLKAIGFPKVPTSKAITYLFYTPSIIAMLFYLTHFIKKFPKSITLISDYSFSIYLLHYSVLFGVNHLLYLWGIRMNVSLYIPLLFSVGLYGSIVIAYLINLFPQGKYVVGSIGGNRKLLHNNKDKVQQAVHVGNDLRKDIIV